MDTNRNFDNQSNPMHIQYAANTDGIVKIARKSSKNDYMFDSLHGHGPLDFMDLDLQEEAEYFYIQKSDGEIIAAAIMKTKPESGDIIDFDALTVHEDFQRQGIATELLLHVMNHADKQNKTLKIDGFFRDGYEFIKNTLPEIHQNDFQNLRIQIEDDPKVIDGHQSYELPQIDCIDELPDNDALDW